MPLNANGDADADVEGEGEGDGYLSACCRLASECCDAMLIYEPIQQSTAVEAAGGPMHCPSTNKLIGGHNLLLVNILLELVRALFGK